MASLGDVGELTEEEYSDLDNRVDRFHAAWKADGTSALEEHVPPPGVRHRQFVLVELIKTEMELRAKAGMEIRIEAYFDRFPNDLTTDAVPVSLLIEEYRLRHLYADKPGLDEYQTRFHNQFDAFKKRIPANPGMLAAAPPQRPRRHGSVGFESLQVVVSTPNPDAAAPTKVTVATVKPDTPRVPKKSQSFGSGPAADILPADLEYKLLRRIGKGAFGEVYEALAPGGFKVAVKRILRSVDHPATQGDLEALEAIKSMSHPFLLQTHAYWVLEDRLILVMDLAEGSLAERIEFHRKNGLPGIPPEELVPFFEQAAEALDYLHSHSVSHRDVKPENLLLLKGYAKVADFGLARAQEHLMTTVGMEIGTPAYMAPEVCGGKVSLHSDQYSLAATYVAARLGRTLYDTKLRYEMEHHHVNTIPKLDPLSPAEQEVVLKALSKRPGDRYPSCVAFAKALRKVLLEPPAPPSGRRNTILLASAAALICGLAAGLAGWFVNKPTIVPTTEPTQAEAPNPWCPTGWNPVAAGGTTSASNKAYYNRLTREIAGEPLTAILVVPTRPTDPDVFYMLENKVTNRVFQAAWESAIADPKSSVRRYRDNMPNTEWLLPGEWRKGAPELAPGPEGQANRLGIGGHQAGVPVVGVTVPEAMLVAQELGGQLPTYKQWLKAVGAEGDGNPPGPAGPDVAGTIDEKRALLSQRGLALGLEQGPWPVSKSTPDKSYCGIQQLVSNGQEWTSENAEGRRVDLTQQPATGEQSIRLVGQSWEKPTVLTFQQLVEQKRLAEWSKWNQYAGFRLVLEPR